MIKVTIKQFKFPGTNILFIIYNFKAIVGVNVFSVTT